jgi:methyl-accepting chemotaxis protein
MMARNLLDIIPSAKDPSSGWILRLRSAADDLLGLNVSTEKEFLAIGERLQEFYRQAGDITQLTSSIATRMSGEEITAIVTELDGIIQDIETLGDDSRKGVEVLTLIISGFENIQRPLGGFEKIVKNLHVLGNFVRIESARMRSADKSFETLVSDIKNLAVNIGLKSRELLDQSLSLRRQIQDNLNNISAIKASLDEHTKAIIDDTNAKILSLTERHEWSLGIIKGFTERWESISKSVSEIVMSIQFHDITRQEIEHVHSALEDVADKIQPPAIKPNGRGFFRRIRQGSVLPPVMYQPMGTAVAVCDLQVAQLGHAGEEMDSAVNRILQNLQGVAAQTQAMSDDIKVLVGSSGESGQSFLAELAEGLAKMVDALNRYTDVSLELSKATGRIPETVGHMSSLVAIIDKIGFDMKMVALNACIHAERIGSEGIALGVLAESLHEMSVSTMQEIQIISGELSALIDTAQALSPARASDGEGKEAGRMNRHLEEMLSPLRKLNDDTAGLLSRMDASGKSFIGDIERTAAGFKVHERMGRVIDGVKSELATVISGIRSVLPAEILSQQYTELDKLAGRYTMDKERDIHQTLFLTDTAAGVAAAVDPVLFAAGMPAAPVKDGEDLGDNVELF